jgi:hypothetical protein
LWYERLRVQSPLIAQERGKGFTGPSRRRPWCGKSRRKKKDVESEKTGSLERSPGDQKESQGCHDGSEGGDRPRKIGLDEGKVGDQKNLGQVDPGMGQV